MTSDPLRDQVRAFCESTLRPGVKALGRDGGFPRDLYRAMGEQGLFAAPFPERYGGTELGFGAAAVMAEEVARVHPGLTAGFNMQCMTVPLTILNWGSDELRRRYVAKLIKADWIGFFGLTESGSGTDVLGSMRTTGVRDGDHYVLHGSKMFATLANEAAAGLVFARTGDIGTDGHGSLSAFVVDADAPGFTARVIPTSTLGTMMPTCAVRLDGVRVPAGNRLGAEGEGFKVAMNALDYGRLAVAARSVGVIQACLDHAVAYAKRRTAFGQPIAEFQLIKRLIADTAVDLEAARLLVEQAGARLDMNLPATRESSIAKYFAGEACVRAAQAAFEVFGGYAVVDNNPISMLLNYAHLYKLGEGSANMQRILIADDALGLRAANRHHLRRPFQIASDHAAV